MALTTEDVMLKGNETARSQVSYNKKNLQFDSWTWIYLWTCHSSYATVDLLCELTWHPARSRSAGLCETRPRSGTGLHLCAWYWSSNPATLAACKKRCNQRTRVAMTLAGVCALMSNSVLTAVFQEWLRFLDHNDFDPPSSGRWFSLP